MEPTKAFNNVIIGQFVLTGVPVKVYADNRYLTITDPDDVEDPIFGFGMDEDGDMHQFNYTDVTHLGVSGNKIDLETYNKGMEAKFKGGQAKEEPKDEEPKDDKEDKAAKESNMKLGDLIKEISEEEVEAEMEAAKAEIDAAKAKFKASRAAMKDTIKKSKDKMKAAKANLKVATEGHLYGHDDEDSELKETNYTFGVGDIVKNKNSSCPHHGSMGTVKKMMYLPNDIGTVALYTVMNSGDTFNPGDVLAKTIDQLEPIQNPDELEELDVRDKHGDEKIENPKTGKKIKFSSALKAPKGTQVYNKARKRYNQLKDK